jgi:hypothetical protein
MILGRNHERATGSRTIPIAAVHRIFVFVLQRNERAPQLLQALLPYAFHDRRERRTGFAQQLAQRGSGNAEVALHGLELNLPNTRDSRALHPHKGARESL